jgi:hypothetical protein
MYNCQYWRAKSSNAISLNVFRLRLRRRTVYAQDAFIYYSHVRQLWIRAFTCLKWRMTNRHITNWNHLWGLWKIRQRNTSWDQHLHQWSDSSNTYLYISSTVNLQNRKFNDKVVSVNMPWKMHMCHLNCHLQKTWTFSNFDNGI